jgi:vacuolar-type H+-ATPase subunit H
MPKEKTEARNAQAAAAMERVLAAESDMAAAITASKDTAEAQVAAARTEARRILERAERRLGRIHEIGERQLEQQIAVARAHAREHTPTAMLFEGDHSNVHRAAERLAAILTSGSKGDEH